MKLKHLITVIILSFYCSFSEASEHKVLNFIEFYKTTLSDVEQYLKSNKCKYKVNEVYKGYRKFKTINVSNCFNLPNEKESTINLIYLNSIKDFVLDEVRIKYTIKNNNFDKYQKKLKKRYGTPINKQNNGQNFQLAEWEDKNYLVSHFTFGKYGEVWYSGMPDASVGDFDYGLLDNNSLLGFIELNKTSLENVEEMLYRLKCYNFDEKESTSFGVKTKSFVLRRCFFLPKLTTVIIDAIDKGSPRRNIVDNVSFIYQHDKKHHELYINLIKSKYGVERTIIGNISLWYKDKFEISVSEPLKDDPFFTDTKGSITFQTNERQQLLEDGYKKTKKEIDSLNSL